MKKFFLFVSCVVTFVSCSSDDSGGKGPGKTSVGEQIVGEWVYDNPSSGQWEKQTLRSNMTLNYSSLVLNPYVFVDEAEGSYYFTSEDRFTMTYQNIMGYTSYADVEVKDIDKYSYTAVFRYEDGMYGGEYIYHRLIDDVELEFGESATPAYSRIITDAVVQYYYSNDEEIAKVNASSGEITASNHEGVTYINVVTNHGTAVVEVRVADPDNLIPDYSAALNMNEEEVKRQWPNYCTYNPPMTDRVCYPLRGDDYAQMVTMYLDSDRNVESIIVQLKEIAVGNEAQESIRQYLGGKYEFQEYKNNHYMYLDVSQTGQLPMAVLYYPTQGMIEYVKLGETIQGVLWPDYSQHFGFTAEEIKEQYGEPFYEDSEALYFLQENDYVEFVAFTLNASGKIYASSAFLKSGCDWQVALDYLNSQYNYYENGSSPTKNYFAFINGMDLQNSSVGITFDGVNGVVTYVDLTASRMVKGRIENTLFPKIKLQRPSVLRR